MKAVKLNRGIKQMIRCPRCKVELKLGKAIGTDPVDLSRDEGVDWTRRR